VPPVTTPRAAATALVEQYDMQDRRPAEDGPVAATSDQRKRILPEPSAHRLPDEQYRTTVREISSVRPLQLGAFDELLEPHHLVCGICF
jgi:hypothetical protein